MAIFSLNGKSLSPMSDSDPDPGPKSQAWHKVNVVKVEEIPGAGKQWVTIRTSDKTLWDCNLIIRSVSNTRVSIGPRLLRHG